MNSVNSVGGGAWYYASYASSQASQTSSASLATAESATFGNNAASSAQSSQNESKSEIWENLPHFLSDTRKLNISAKVLYELSNEPYPTSITKHISKGGTQRWHQFPAGKEIGDYLKNILSPDQYKKAMIATAEAGGTGKNSRAQEVAAAIQTLESEFEGPKLSPTPLEERDWVKDMTKYPGMELKDEYLNAVHEMDDVEPETMVYTPRDDFLKIAMEAKDDIETLLNVVNELDGVERAQVLHHLANEDWQYMRNELGKLANKSPDQILPTVQRIFEGRELAKSLGGAFPFHVNTDGLLQPLTTANIQSA